MSGNGVGMHAVRRGKGSPVVLVHGWACSHAVWAPVVDELGEAYETVAFDLPGFGASERMEGAFTLADLATAVDDALESLGVVDAVVVGHSMGGMVVQHLYAISPKRVAGLVLCGTTSAAGPPYQQTTKQLNELIKAQGSAALAAAMAPGLFGARYRQTHVTQVEEFVEEVAACDEASFDGCPGCNHAFRPHRSVGPHQCALRGRGRRCRPVPRGLPPVGGLHRRSVVIRRGGSGPYGADGITR